MNLLKEITKNLMDYLIDGKIDSTVVEWYDTTTGAFPSTYITGQSFKFLRKFEQIDTITDPHIIPVLLVTIPDKYKEGTIMKNNTFIDLKQLLVSDTITNKFNFFVVPFIESLLGNVKGTLQYVVNVDYNSDYDVYGYIADEISELIKLMYYKKSGNYYTLTIADNRKFFFVPATIEQFSNGAILGRIKHRFNIRGCNFI